MKQTKSMKEDIKKIILEKPKVFSKIIKSKYPELYFELKNNDISFSESLWIWLNNKQTCKICSSPTKFLGIKNGYKIYCSAKCAAQDSIVLEKRKTTNFRKYGVENPFQNKEIQKKYNNTMKRKYGVINPSSSKQIQNKKTKNNYEKYGVSHWMKLNEYKDKVTNTTLERYGVNNHSKSHFSNKTKELIDNEIELLALYEKYKSCEKIAELLNVGATTIQKRLRDKDFFIKRGGFSWPQKEIEDFLNELQISFISNTRKITPPKEIDIFVPDYNIGIEFCGLYWHSESNINDKFYHYKKYKECLDKNIRLITIFSDEWFNKKEICKNRLRAIFQKSPTLFGARQTIIKPISYSESKEFLEKTHIQGSCIAKYRYGAFFKNKLVSVMTFSKRRKALGSTSDQFELLRFSSLYPIPGMASKFLKVFINEVNPKEIISYSDRRWNTGNVYEKIGFELISETKPNYWWVENYKVRHHRFKFAKHKLVKQGFSKELTESKIMYSLGYDRIWDCGNLKFIWSQK